MTNFPRNERRYGRDWPTLADVPRTRPRRWPPLRLCCLLLIARWRGYRSASEFLHEEWPYGRWFTADGREVLFNRKYRPLLHRQHGSDWTPYAGPDWVEGIVDQQWFYYSENPPWRDEEAFARLQAVLQELLYPARRGRS